MPIYRDFYISDNDIERFLRRSGVVETDESLRPDDLKNLFNDIVNVLIKDINIFALRRDAKLPQPTVEDLKKGLELHNKKLAALTIERCKNSEVIDRDDPKMLKHINKEQIASDCLIVDPKNFNGIVSSKYQDYEENFKLDPQFLLLLQLVVEDHYSDILSSAVQVMGYNNSTQLKFKDILLVKKIRKDLYV